MKRYSILAALFALLVVGDVAGQPLTKTTSLFTAKSFATAVNRTDTSAAFPVNAWPFIELATSTTGTDSLRIISTVDYQIAGKWVSGSLDTLKFGPATANNKSRGLVLRSYAANIIPGATSVRIRNKLHPFRTADSTGPPSYTQWVLSR